MHSAYRTEGARRFITIPNAWYSIQLSISSNRNSQNASGTEKDGHVAYGKQVVVVSGSKFVVIDVKRRSVLWSIDMPSEGKVVTVSPDSGLAFVSHPDATRVSIIDLLKRRITNSFVVGKQPDGVAFYTLPTAK